MKKYLPIPVAALVAFVVAAAMSTASIPDQDGIVNGCYQPHAKGQAGGALSVIDSASQECPSGATALNWHQGPAVVASGQGTNTCSISTEGTTYCDGSAPGSMTFTPDYDALCLVNADGHIVDDSGGGNAAQVTFGVAVYTRAEGNQPVGAVNLSTAYGSFNSADSTNPARSALLPVEDGVEYTIHYRVGSVPASTGGTAYVNETYLCFRA